MITTPVVARTKRCCFFDKYCDGDDCMAWMSYVSYRGVLSGATGDRIIGVKDGRGYCGRLPYEALTAQVPNITLTT